jgi:hypothetical protein
MMRRRQQLGILVVAASAAGCQPLDRADGIGEGGVRVTVVDEAGAPVAGARVAIVGSPRVATSDENGLAALRGLVPGDYALHVGVDDDEDGVFDRAAIRGDMGTIRVKDIAGRLRRTVFLTGPIAVAATGEIRGTVDVPDGELARVVAVRTLALGTDNVREVQLPVEASSGVDVDGGFRLRGLAPGEVTLVAFAWPRPTSTQPRQQLIAASRPARFARQTVTVGSSDVVFADLAAVPDSAAVVLALAGDLADARNGGEAIFSVPQDGPDLAVGVIDGLTAASPRTTIDAPVAIFDLTVQLDGFGGGVPLVVGLPGAAWLPVPVGLDPQCLGRERNAPDPEDCGGDFDGDGVLDKDDTDKDGDGVEDEDEPTACRVPGLGGDRDRDCLCDAADPYPDCASNDPVDCTPAAPIVCD